MPSRDAQRMLDVIQKSIDTSTQDGAKVDFRHGVVSVAGSKEISAFLMGNSEASENIVVDAGMYVGVGDFIVVGILGTRKWVERILPRASYSKTVIDHNDGKLYWGNGTAEPTNVVDLTNLTTGGSAGGSRAFSFFSG